MADLNWAETSMTPEVSGDNLNEAGLTLVSAISDATNQQELQSAVEAAVKRAVELMTRNVRDESRYFICEWNTSRHCLGICVTDETKTIESPIALELSLPGMAEIPAEQQTELLKFWLTDYLSTCSDFLHFSVIALFHTGDRNRGILL